MKFHEKMSGAGRWFGIIAAVMMTASVTAYAASTAADSWSVSGSVGDMTITSDGPQATVSFPSTAFPSPAILTLVPAITTGIGSFAGDYIRAGVHTLNFALAGNRSPTSSYITFTGSSGRTWGAGGLVLGANSLSFDRVQGGWELWNKGTGNVNADWATDLSNVTKLGLYVQRQGTTVYTLSVSDFYLTGQQVVGTSQPTLAEVLMKNFGVSSIAEVDPKYNEDNGHGMSFLNAVLAEFDHDYFAKNLFTAELSVDGTVVTIDFNCVKDYTYAVQKSATVGGDYNANVVGTVTATDTGSTNVLDSVGAEGGHSFYRVVEQP